MKDHFSTPFIATSLLISGGLLAHSVMAQPVAATFPVIVVFDSQASLPLLPALDLLDSRILSSLPAWNYLNHNVLNAVRGLELAHNFRASQVFSAALRGFSAQLTGRQIDSLEQDPRVAYIEADGVMRAVAQTIPYGIDRIDADISSTLAGNGSGAVSNVNAYIIDTGIDRAHADLNVVNHVNFIPNASSGLLGGLFGGLLGGAPAPNPNADCNGHGTHVAGTVAARDNASDVVGVAPGAPLTGVKVLDCQGSGSTSGVIKGVDWVTANAIRPAVANMSLGGGASQALDDAVRRSANSGVFYALAAGNEGANACNGSPSRAGAGNNGILTIAATDSANQEASFSNFGACVDVWAPGVGVVSTRLGGGTTTLSGTSMSSPHGAGTGALFLSRNVSASPAAVELAIKARAVNTGTLSKNGQAIKLDNAGTF